MGNVGSHSEGEEEEEETAPCAAATGGARNSGSAAREASSPGAMETAAASSSSSSPAAAARPSAPPSAASLPSSSPSPLLPAASVLLGQARLREEAAARLREAPSAEPLLSRHHAALVRWLEERLGRGEHAVSLEQLCEALEARAGPTPGGGGGGGGAAGAATAAGAAATGGGGSGGEAAAAAAAEERARSEEAFAQFDPEGDGTVDVENMLEALKNSSGANLQGELSHVIRQLQACSLVPGFVDIFSELNERLSLHAFMILRFLHRHRIASTVIPYPVLEYFNNICTMRSSILKDSLDRLLLKEKECPSDLNGNQELDKLKSVSKCYTHIETSSNSADIDKMTNGETSSFWQSDGSARSHWIRLKMKPDVILRHLSIAVAANDQSYMPQQVTVAVGRTASNLQEVRDVHIPSNVTGYVTLLENANISQMYVQINIKRCLSDGCDTRIHGLRAIGYQRVKKGGVSVCDASAIWYWSLLTSLITASMDTNPAIVHAILQNTQKALQHMPPLSLSPGSIDFSSFLSPNVLEEVDSFLLGITSRCASPEVELTLLAFSLARGSIGKVLSSLCTIADHLETPYKAASLIVSMATVRQNLLYKYGTPLRLTLQACDVKGKEDKSGPENLLIEPWTGDGFLTETGKRQASVILSTGTESAFQVTQIRIKVRRGAIGARCGLVFAYNSASEKFHAEEHFKRFESYDRWKLEDFRHFLKARSSTPRDELGEEDPVGWFEMEEEWDEMEVKMQQCRISKYLMVKFLCTRQDKAERLGVQGLSVFGYLRSMSAEPNRSKCCLECGKPSGDVVCGMTLLLKTLCFIQQLAQDLVQKKASGLRYRSYLDFAGLDLKLFWNFYSKLQQNSREECIDAQAMLLRLLQSCFSVLTSDNKAAKTQEAAQSKTSDSAEAAEELYKHLCEVVDSDSESPSLKALKQEVNNTLLNGAAIFFPHRHTRREQLFAMLKNITEQEHKASVHLTFKSLCAYFSDQDPGGLLLLPDKGPSADVDVDKVLAVTETLLAVTSRECEMLMMGVAQQDTGPVLSSLFWSVQGSLLSWCYLQLKGSDAAPKSLAVEILTKYVQQFLLSVRTILESLLSQHSGRTIVEKLSNSVFSMVARQLMTFLQDFCTLDIPHRTLLQDVSILTKLLNDLSADPGDGPNKVGMESWQQEQPVVLRTWAAESPHNYENNCHDVTVFLCPGATYFEVEFDERCETERRYDYLEFTDAKGGKTRYDTKVGTDKWPKKVTFKAGPRLQFLFHSDSSNNEWGYKFSVTAYGLPDVEVSWGLDLHLLVARLMGRLASQSMVLKSQREAGNEIELSPAKVASVLNSPLWKPVFRHQMRSEQKPEARERSQTPQEDKEATNSHSNNCHNFLLDFAKSDTAQEFCGPNSELFKGLVQACKKQAPKTDIVAGSTIDQAVQSTFAALVYLSPDLYGKLQKYVNSGGKTPLGEEFAQVYSLADGIRIWMLEMKQKSLVNQGSDGEEKQAAEMSEVNPETLAQQCIQKSHLLLSFLPARTKAEGHDSDHMEDFGRCHKDRRRRTSSVVEADFQASDSSPVSGVTGFVFPEASQATASSSKRKQVPDSPQTEVSPASQSKSLDSNLSEQEDALSPPSTPTRKPPFSRGRLRLLSFRSMEESKPVPSIKEKYPILKHTLDFIKDQSLSHESVLKVLALRKAQAKSILEVLKMILQCLESLSQPHCFTPPCIIFLLELLACQKDFTNYFAHLEGCGAELHREIRESYYQLLLFLVNALKGFNDLDEKSLLPALSCVQTSLLHLLDMGWEPSDLSFFVDIQLPRLLISMSRENISTHDSIVCQWSEEEELADYKQNSEWMDECQEGVFESWCDKISQADPEKQRKMHMFIARYCDLLHVDISCDGCDEIAPWHRYRCLQCNDMDLCKTCFLGGVRPEGHEANHDMVNMEYACDHCQGIIVGQRMNCNVCEDFDLCFGCYSAKKYSESHLPTHSVTAHPMMTIRISDRHRLIQPYLHNYSWLLFSALALYSADLSSGKQGDGEEELDPQVVAHARTLQQECIQLIGDCLVKVQHGKGLKSLALLCMLPESESLPEKGILSVENSTDSPGERAMETDKAMSASFTHCNGNGNTDEIQASADTKQTQKVKTEGKPSNGLPLKKEVVTHEREKLALNSDFQAKESISADAEVADILTPCQAEEKAMPSQEEIFAECSQKRILGLLAAMLPRLKSDSTMSLMNLDQILPLMFQVVISNAGHLNETYHLTLGLLGQLIRRLMPAEVDAAVTTVLSAKHGLVAADGSSVPEGWKTTHLLFSLGAVCLDSRVGLDWACTMADILRALNASVQWHSVIAAFTDHCIKQLPFQLKHTNIFTLLVLVGFPEVLCMGTRSVYMDNANEAHNVIILKHFTEKNRAVVVDMKTRKRKAVKDLQLVQPCGQGDDESRCQLRQYLQHFVFITSHLLQTSINSSFAEAVEATWVLSLALKGLYRTLKMHPFEEIRTAFLQTGLLKLLVKKCSKGTGFSKTWLLRDLEILSIMLYSSKKEISSLAEHKGPDLGERDQDQALDQSAVTPTDADQNRLDPLEGLDETTKICFLMTHDALDAPLHILRAMYELQMKRTDSFFLEVQKRFDGDVVTTDERIRTLAQKWQPSKCLRSEEQSSKALDTDMIIVPCLPAPVLQSKPAPCNKATEESNPITQKLITNTESDLQLSYAKQRRTKSSVLLHKELDSRSKKAVRGYLYRVNDATAVLYARHALALLLAKWPDDVAISEEMLELSGPAHMTYILDMLLQLEEKQLCEKILLKVLRGCNESMLATMALTACQFMEEPGMAVQVRESKHPYNNNTNFEDKVHIPGAIYLSVKFDSQCNTEEGCDELVVASSCDFIHDRHTFSGPPHKWTDFELPGDTLYYRFTTDMSNTEWGYKFTVTAGHLGRFQTGFEILKQMLSEERVIPHIPLAKIWEWQVGVACRQTGHQRLKAIHLLLRIVQCCSERDCDLTLLKPLWHLFSRMENSMRHDVTKSGILLPLHRALTELFFVTESRVSELGSLQDYLLALNTEDHLHRCTAQALKNIAALSLAINYPNKSTSPWNV
ncbi:zinc finger ZZ-type and EF-hand domain-containing protein 1 isoform X1 [Lacerta agilis]|uniref:zinc finger ZZ-type and EF-hand domain-containing protein 1 isoform X1 n=1 Tax=Lacerta agilis TaxID=80427 RepID=UPI00141A353B|nr:zinc finger ZZ-type and EF-hand domain-containing protein 1 isoform X1 [Lacerta agilis]